MSVLLALLLAVPGQARPHEAARRSTVQISSVAREPDWSQPWQFQRQRSGSGSGVVIDGRRILTNAHVVGDSSFLTVRKSGDVKNYPAKVEFVSHASEIAMLTVDDPAFFEGTRPAPFGDLPSPGDTLTVYGFPTGGSELSITEGVVSRVGVVTYAHSSRRLLAVQTDAAINPGDSGGPVFKDGKMVGIAFQHLASPGAQNISYAVPIPLVRRFLDDVKDGRYDGVPAIGIVWQETENPALRARYGLSADASGVLINRVLYGSSGWGVLQPGDALVSLDGVKIGQNGTILLRSDERVDFGDLIARRQVGHTLKAEVVRDGKPLALELTLKPLVELVPGPRHDERPSYLMVGGLVFMPLSENFLRAHGGGTHKLRTLQYEDYPAPERSQHVVLSQVLAHEVNRGYHGWALLPVQKVNGRAIGSMKALVEAFQSPQDGRHVIEFDPTSRAVLDAAAAARALPEISQRYGVSQDRSDDLK